MRLEKHTQIHDEGNGITVHYIDTNIFHVVENDNSLAIAKTKKQAMRWATEICYRKSANLTY